MKETKENGITLIALIVTVIILLILAGVSISMVSGDGLFSKARSASETYKAAANNETKILEEYENFMQEYTTGGSTTTTQAGEEGYVGGSTPTVPDGPYKHPYIPEGFTHTEGEWNSGYTIKNSTTDDEFVWVPCTTTATSETVAFARITDNTTKYNLYGLTDFTDQSGAKADLIRTSVGTYGGFYIAKYEASESSGTAKSVPNATPWTNITRTNAITAAEAMVNTTDGVKSALISGECWDTTLQWMVTKSDNVTENTTPYSYDTNSTGKGWYSGNSGYDVHNTGTSVATANANRVNNIWDMAGNVYEWTTENCQRNGDDKLVGRGGFYAYSGSSYPAADRNIYSDSGNISLGFRSVLYK